MEGSAEILSINPEHMDAIPAEQRPVVLAHLLALQARIIAKMSGEAPTGTGAGGDRLMGVEEMAHKRGGEDEPEALPPGRHHAGARPLPARGERGTAVMKKGSQRGRGRIFKRPDSPLWWIAYMVDRLDGKGNLSRKEKRESTGSPK